MRAVLLVAVVAVLISACGEHGTGVVGPTSAPPAVVSSPAAVAKVYAIGGVVRSSDKLSAPVDAAVVRAFVDGGDVESTVTGADGSFGLAVRAGTVTLTVTSAGYVPWSTVIFLYENRPDIRPTLDPVK